MTTKILKPRANKSVQLVRVMNPRHHAYGRIGMVKGSTNSKWIVCFVDAPQNAENQQIDPTGLAATFTNDELALLYLPMADFYLLVTIVERHGDRRYEHQCLAHGRDGQQPKAIVNSITQCWIESSGEWDADEQLYRLGTHHFVLAEHWCKITMADYANWSILADRTPGYVRDEDF